MRRRRTGTNDIHGDSNFHWPVHTHYTYHVTIPSVLWGGIFQNYVTISPVYHTIAWRSMSHSFIVNLYLLYELQKVLLTS
jgi:hypothetical protein